MPRSSVLLVSLALATVGLAQSPLYGQCGGDGWTGPTTCVSGATCVYSNQWYSQCLPGSGTTAPTTTANPPATTTTSSGGSGTNLPTTYKWSSSGPLVNPKSDSYGLAALKDPSIVYYGGKYHVFASTAKAAGYNLVYFSFTDFNAANSATFSYLDKSPIGTGYRAAPQVFYFAPQSKWYLVYQNGNAAYSTNSDISNPSGWTAPKNFYSGVPATITNNIGSGYWVDMWVICDSSYCHLFSSDDNGHLYRSQTTVSNFPNGMSEPVIALSDSNKNNLFEAANVYKVGSKYLLLVECIGSKGRYFRSWTATSLSGTWTALAATEANPWAGANNVAFSGTAWTQSISHGELVRSNVDQTMTVSTCGMQYFYQGLPTGSSGDYNALPWKLALLTQTSPC